MCYVYDLCMILSLQQLLGFHVSYSTTHFDSKSFQWDKLSLFPEKQDRMLKLRRYKFIGLQRQKLKHGL